MCFLDNGMSFSGRMGAVQHISRFCHSSLEMNAMSMQTLGVTANEKHRRSYSSGGEGCIHCNYKRANGLIKSKYRQPSLWLQWQAAIEGTGKLMAGWAKATEECTVVNVCAQRRPSQDGPPSPPLLLCPLQALPINTDIIPYEFVYVVMWNF